MEFVEEDSSQAGKGTDHEDLLKKHAELKSVSKMLSAFNTTVFGQKNDPNLIFKPTRDQ